MLPHTTSKIESAEDLYSLTTLGFRGEALSSLAASARLEIISRRRDNQSGWKLCAENSRLQSLEICRANPGTVVSVSDLFFSIPARKHFLKSTAAEHSLCRSTFTDKVLPFPEISFRFFSDNELKTALPAGTQQDRIISAFPALLKNDYLIEAEAENENIRIKAYTSVPEVYRQDRKYIHIYINNRKISDYPLMQAVEYAYSGFLHGGAWPYAFIFLEIDPSLADFNIHPAKKEVRLKNAAEIHSALVKCLSAAFNRTFRLNFREQTESFSPVSHEQKSELLYEQKNLALQNISPALDFAESMAAQVFEIKNSSAAYTPETKEELPFRYIGQIFRLFLAAETKDSLYLIDQHAAHEKILYLRFINQNQALQKLLFPCSFEADEDDRTFTGRLEEAGKKGIIIKRLDKNSYEITALPESMKGLENEITDYLCGNSGDEAFSKDLYAGLACKAAVKEGRELKWHEAVEIIREAFELENARCPHGRPVWLKLSLGELQKKLGRT
jgi:DNA mismatch repair protein MutL